jgi:basic membrane protein A and related proteins
MKKLLCVLVVVISLFGVPLFAGGGREAAPAAPATAAVGDIGVVYSMGGRGDGGFNDLVYIGASQAAEDFGLELVDIEPGELAQIEPSLRALARRDLSIIFAVGFTSIDFLQRVARDHPDQNFAIVDAAIDLPNVASLLFKEHEGSFLVGAIAGLITETNTVGFVGGMESDLIRKFEVGYTEGVKYVNPDATVRSAYVGVTAEAFRDPARGRELALSHYDGGADIVFAAAGMSGGGVIEAAESEGAFAIGVDTNQNPLAPGYVLTSMLKRVDTAVYNTVAAVVEGQFTPGISRFGLAEDGVGYAVDEHNEHLLSQDLVERVDELKNKIISGEIVVTDPMAQ